MLDCGSFKKKTLYSSSNEVPFLYSWVLGECKFLKAWPPHRRQLIVARLDSAYWAAVTERRNKWKEAGTEWLRIILKKLKTKRSLWKEARSFKNTEHASIFGFNWNESVQYGSNGEWVVGRVGMHEFRKAQDVALQIRKNRSQKKLSN